MDACNAETQQTVRELASALLAQLHEQQQQQRFIVAVAGTAGSGKTHLCGLIRDAANAGASSDVCVVLPMDGFHLSKAQLTELDDPALALRRRGAHWTFDAPGFAETVRRVRHRPTEVTLAPAFDHAAGDPVPCAIAVEPHHRLVLVEGLYAHAGEEPWAGAARLADERWWISPRCPAASRSRLVRRHVRAGLAADDAAAELRIAENDDLNSAFVMATRLPPTRIVPN
ncbi:hypothetical protein LPJ61_002644 [Coemansia biformis]|uniref:P-loop containing nucleoside triphosphate hydrolase protein n=1 Tax=Coemansia biformis TaxID=1286918 RepID=A0A9W7Y7Y6_9FUNG|nr:hypothetical protein LPJ61_002644 [Coemansia biformis]